MHPFLASTLFFAAVAAQAGAPATLNVHLALSDSVSQNLRKGTISAAEVVATNDTSTFKPVSMDTTTATAVVRGVTPGKWKIVTLLVTSNFKYVVDPAGKEVLVTPGSTMDVYVDVPSIVFVGRARYRGEPLTGVMNVGPAPGASGWGFGIPLDSQGRFVFPLPHAGKWNVTFSSRQRQVLAKLQNFELRSGAAEVTIDVPEAAVEVVRDRLQPVSVHFRMPSIVPRETAWYVGRAFA